MKRSAFACLVAVLLCGSSVQQAQTESVIVDHTSIDLFDQIPEQYLVAAFNLRMMYADRSVGMNIWQNLASISPKGCLTYESTALARSACKRWTHDGSSTNNPQSGEFNSPPQLWARPGGYTPPAGNWQYYGWPGSGIPPELPCSASTGMWWGKPECFVNYVMANPNAYDVYGWQPSYLEVSGGDIASPTTGYFVSQPNRADIYDVAALESMGLTIFHHTSSLARGIGTAVSTSFNQQMRAYVAANGGYLLDVADIESHDPWGQPCYDNRDGVPYYRLGTLRENYPDNGFNYPAICQHYTSEHDGGHLGAPSAGGTRLAKAYVVLMARRAGWNPGS